MSVERENCRYENEYCTIQHTPSIQNESQSVKHFLVSILQEQFCEPISLVLVSWDVNNIECIVFDTFTDEMVHDVDVLGALMMLIIF